MVNSICSSFLLLAVLAPFITQMANLKRTEADELRVKPFYVLFLIAIFTLGLLISIRSFGFEFVFLPIAAAFAITAVFFQPSVALAAYLSFLLLRPWELSADPGALAAIPRIGALLVLTAWLLAAFRGRSRGLVISDVLVAFFLFFLWLLLSSSFVLGTEASYSFARERWIPIAVLAVVISAVLREEKDRHSFQLSLIFASLGVLVTSAVQTLSTEALSPTLRLSGSGLLGNSNDLAALAVLALSLLLFQPRGSFLLKIILAPCFLVLLWFTQSRGGIAAFGIACLVFAFFKLRSRFARISLTILASVLIITMIGLLGRSEGDMTMSSSSRWNYVVTGLRMVRAHPLTGIGVDQYPEQYEKYSSVFYEWGERTAHSSWILALSEGGIPGFLLFFFLIAIVLLRSFFVRINAPELTAALIGYLFAMSFLSHTYLFLPYVLFFLVVAAHNRAGKNSDRYAEHGKEGSLVKNK